MLDQVLPAGEALPAEPTAVRLLPAVQLQVSDQTLPAAEVQAAEAAAVRLLPGVDALVDLHPLHGAPFLPADVAGDAQFFVGLQVLGERLRRLQVLPADPAEAVGLLAVAFGVPQQDALRVEGAAAHFAAEARGGPLVRRLLPLEAARQLVLVLPVVPPDVFPQTRLGAELPAAAAAGERDLSDHGSGLGRQGGGVTIQHIAVTG